MAQRSPLGLIVLGLLTEEPMHVYRMQKLIERYGKDRVVNVRRRASLYQAIDRLTRLGLVEVRQRESTDNHPDRTVYAITDLGRETAERWLREMLRTTGGEFPEFVAAVSVLVGLPPDAAREELETRARALAASLAEVESTLRSSGTAPRLFLLEEEYRRAVLTAELEWVRGVVEDLRQGRLTWDEPWRRAIAAAHEPPEEET
ncbi:PadR family transcriptional regulator [Nonomuraea rhodomycinica]|uniref:PadR family transcriptional regulator n=1 Tax=Nonomuraea rhodomycinica TaxID=1712872 RepID=A0A7Y6IMI9_9ACTN|nr:PadR family transcriptional regulator [Nonomuraea rhodomycinica]NUW40932.1 PadR family transcriptional regulator [Nonomuraea rhodomycinica]